MGDRTWVTIYIRKTEYLHLVDDKFNGDMDKFNEYIGIDDSDDDGVLISLMASELNCGNWDTLEALLTAHDIEFDKFWGDGNEYSAGKAYYRKTPKGFKLNEISEDQESVIAFLEKCRTTPEANLKQLIEDTYKYHMPFEPTPLDRENSVRFVEEE